MSLVKTRIDETRVKHRLEQNYNAEIQDFQFIKGGQLSQAFSFRVRDDCYVIRIRKDIESFEKERMIFKKLAQEDPTISVPRIHEIGVYQRTGEGTLHYCISEKCEGEVLYQLGQEAISRLKTPLLETLYKIHQVDIADTENYGVWLSIERAPYPSWAAFLDDYVKTKVESLLDFFADQAEEIAFIERLAQKIKELCEFCPEERHLIHGDYGPNNTLVTTSGKITGIIDWELAQFGDFVYDIGWLEFWGYFTQESYKGEYRELYESRANQKIEHYDERLLCYILCTGLHMAHFDCMSGQSRSYELDKERILDLLGE